MRILDAWNYAWSVLSACFVLGIVVYILDRKFGVRVYRFLYNVFHKDAMPESLQRGFLYNQSSNRGVTVAVFLSTIYSLGMVWELGFQMSFIAELLVWFLMPPALLVGFWAGRMVYKLLLHRSEIFDKMDELGEKADQVSIEDVAQKVKGAGTSFGERLRGMFSFVSRAKLEDEPASTLESKPEVQKAPKVDPREQIKNYVRGR